MRTFTKILFTFSLVFSLSACGYGAVPDTAKMSPAGSGVDVKIGEMQAQEILVITDGTNAVLTAVLVNTGDAPEVLEGASVNRRLVQLVDISSGVPVDINELVIPAKSSVSLSFLAPYGAVLDATDEVAPIAGTSAKVMFSFANNGFVKAEALTFENSEMYAEVNPAQFVAVD